MAETLFWTFSLVAALLFLLQAVLWAAVRMRKVTIARWRQLSRTWFVCGILLFAAASAAWVWGDAAMKGRAAPAGIMGGLFNALIALFHQRVVTILSRRK